MKKTTPLIGITLEGFQVFDKPTYIPLDGLTLIFGPNSAGKSAVQDAIELFGRLLASDAVARDEGIEELLRRHWRRSGEDDDCYVDELSIGVALTLPCNLETVLDMKLDRQSSGESGLLYPLQLEYKWHLTRDPSDEPGVLLFKSDFEFFIESKLLVSQVGSKFCVNLGHPILRYLEKKVDFTEVATVHPGEVSYQDGIFTMNRGVMGFHPSGLGFREKEERWLDYLLMEDVVVDNRNKGRPLLMAALAELGLFVGTLLSVSKGKLDFLPITAEASRTVPTRSDVTFELRSPAMKGVEHIFKEDMADYSIYRWLAASLTSDHIPIPNVWFGDLNPSRTYADNVNRVLADHLFLDQGYRIDYDFSVLLSKANSLAAVAGHKLDPDEFGYTVELFLRDGKGRKHIFEDVGSGIGYSLPVLCAAFHPYFSICTIQQPELHIHPALQAAMGDVFIDARSTGKQVLIETHSEHLLLRILKRIRQTHLQAVIAPELRIRADEVSILYFDPSPDGSTKVKRLRISEDGEFMDRWPRGFFPERDQELLDE